MCVCVYIYVCVNIYMHTLTVNALHMPAECCNSFTVSNICMMVTIYILLTKLKIFKHFIS